MGKFLQTNLVPVHIRDVTVAEDHYFQQKMMEKLITDLGALLKDDKQSLRHSSTELTSMIDAIADEQSLGNSMRSSSGEPTIMIDAIAVTVEKAEHAGAATADSISHQLPDLICVAMSWGAFSYSDLQAGNNTSANEQDVKHEVEKLIPSRLLGMLPSIFRALKSLDTLYGYAPTSKAGFESTLICVVMLSGAMMPTAAGLHQFESMLADVAERFDEGPSHGGCVRVCDFEALRRSEDRSRAREHLKLYRLVRRWRHRSQRVHRSLHEGAPQQRGLVEQAGSTLRRTRRGQQRRYHVPRISSFDYEVQIHGRHVDRCEEDGAGPKLDVTEWHRLKDELCRGVAMRLIATYDRSTVVSCKYLLTYFLCAAREDSVRPFAPLYNEVHGTWGWYFRARRRR